MLDVFSILFFFPGFIFNGKFIQFQNYSEEKHAEIWQFVVFHINSSIWLEEVGMFCFMYHFSHRSCRLYIQWNKKLITLLVSSNAQERERENLDDGEGG